MGRSLSRLLQVHRISFCLPPNNKRVPNYITTCMRCASLSDT
jgi:hypothetical protein